MEGISCDRCGGALLVGSGVRYVATIDVRAAYDMMEISREDLERDHSAEIRALLAKLDRVSEEEATRQVHASFRFDLCPSCQKQYVAAPLPRPVPPPSVRPWCQVEREAIAAAIRSTWGDVGGAAKALGLRRGDLTRRLKRLGIDPAAYRG